MILPLALPVLLLALFIACLGDHIPVGFQLSRIYHYGHVPSVNRNVFARHDLNAKEQDLYNSYIAEELNLLLPESRIGEYFNPMVTNRYSLRVNVISAPSNRFDLPKNRYESFYEPVNRWQASLDQDILWPNITDKATVLAMAMAANDAYVQPGPGRWTDIEHWNRTWSFGWKANGLRGHVFTSEDEDIVIVALKGTSPNIFGWGGPTGDRDKMNDNIMFSCCCARIDATWKPICDCFKSSLAVESGMGKQQCSQSCLQKAINFKDSYYNAARKIYNEIRNLYPHSQIWFTGHSLGGGLSSMMALTTGSPAVTFQVPGDKIFAKRMGFEIEPPNPTSALQFQKKSSSTIPPNSKIRLPIFHFGHNADPIFMGQCSGPWSACYYSGYAIETKCHIGYRCLYELPQARMDIRLHRIQDVISHVITPNKTVPLCLEQKGDNGEEECEDCKNWSFI